MPRTYNKCKFGFVSESDSWCIGSGASSLEASQGVLRQRWLHPGLRQICEETLLNAARLTRAFANLDRALPAGSAGEQECAPLTTAKAKAARRPPLPTTSPCASEREACEAHSEATESPDWGNEEEEANRSDRARDFLPSPPPRPPQASAARPPEPPGSSTFPFKNQQEIFTC